MSPGLQDARHRERDSCHDRRRRTYRAQDGDEPPARGKTASRGLGEPEKRWVTSSCPGSGGPAFRPWSAGCPLDLTCGRAVVFGRCWALLVTLGGPREGPAVLPWLPNREEEQPPIHLPHCSAGMSLARLGSGCVYGTLGYAGMDLSP